MRASSILVSIIAVALFSFSCSSSSESLPAVGYSVPQETGDNISTGALSEAGLDIDKLETLTQLILTDTFPNIHSVLISRANKLVYEKYFGGKDEIVGWKLGYMNHNINSLHDCRSITKSVTSACIGIALSKGLIENIDRPIVGYFQEYADLFDERKSKITIRHLLTMTSGLEWNENISYVNPRNSELRMDFSSDPVHYILSRPLVAEPGSHWNYSGGNTQLLAEIVRMVSGMPIDKFAEKELFQPLGIEKYEWVYLKENMPAAASGLRLRARDLLKFGMLYMNPVEQNILPAEWIEQSLRAQVSREKPGTGYGFQFFTFTETIGGQQVEIQEARGNGGQRIFICRSLDLLVVITAGNYNRWDIVNDSHKAFVDYIIL